MPSTTGKKRTFRLPWLQSISLALTALQTPENDGSPRVVVLGIGQELNGDDAAGVLAARALKRRLAGQGRVLVVDGGAAPENVTGKLRAFGPQLVLLIDAAEMGERPGTIRWLDWQDTTGLSGSSHTLPPAVLGGFLAQSLGCAVGLIGIQPACTDMDSPVSLPVKRAVRGVVRNLARLLSNA